MSEGHKFGLGPGPVIVLVEPQMGENIGAAARAMLNFGLTGLRLVNPRDGWPNAKAGAMAAGASSVVDHARVFDSVEAAIADCQFVLATTARQRDLHLPVYEPPAAAAELRGRVEGGETCALLFGGERSGLASEHIALAQGIFTIPVNPAFSSLNLGAAVLVAAYEWAQAGEAISTIENRLAQAVPATQHDVEGFVGHIFSALEPTGYFHPPEKRDTQQRNIRTALTRAGFTQNEIHLLRGVVKALDKERPREVVSTDPVIRHTATAKGGRYHMDGFGEDAPELTYSFVEDAVISIDHTYVPQAARGKNVALKLVERTVFDARENNWKIIPACSYADVQFKRHPEWAELRHS